MNDLLNNTVYFKKKPVYDRSIYCDKILNEYAYTLKIRKKDKWSLAPLLEILTDEQIIEVYDQVVWDD